MCLALTLNCRVQYICIKLPVFNTVVYKISTVVIPNYTVNKRAYIGRLLYLTATAPNHFLLIC